MLSKPLVVISRPLPQAKRLAQRIDVQDVATLTLPMFDFTPLKVDFDLSSWVSKWAFRPWVIFTSQAAVDYGLNYLRGCDPHQFRLACVGPATAAILSDAGFQSILLPQQDYSSTGLLATCEMNQPEQAALIVTAPGGRRLLQSELAARGWQTDQLFVYRRQQIELTATDLEQLDAAFDWVFVFTSGMAIQVLLGQLPAIYRERCLNSLWIVASRRLQALARELGAVDCRVAAGADNSSLVAALQAALAPALTGLPDAQI